MKPLQIGRMGTLFVAVWSSGYIGGSLAASAMAPLANLWRFAIGGTVLAVIARRRRDVWPRGARGLGAAALVGVLLFTVQFGGLYIGMASGTPASTTALIACSSPLLVAAVGALLRWDRLSWRRWPASLWASSAWPSPWPTGSADPRASPRWPGPWSALPDSHPAPSCKADCVPARAPRHSRRPRSRPRPS